MTIGFLENIEAASVSQGENLFIRADSDLVLTSVLRDLITIGQLQVHQFTSCINPSQTNMDIIGPNNLFTQ